MKWEEFAELQTKNLCLRKFRIDDVGHFYERVGGNEKVTRYMLFQPHKSQEETNKSIEKIMARYEDGCYYTWAIALRSDDSIIGRIDLLHFDEEESRCSFAYMIGDMFWGKGYGTEALQAVLKFAFEKMQMKEVVVDHMKENIASGAVMRKVGMKFVRTITERYEKNGVFHDADEYRITINDWFSC